MAPENEGSWPAHRLDVINTLKRLEAQNTVIIEKMNDIQIDLATHKVRSGIFGAIAGSIVALGSWLAQRITH